MKRKWDFEDEQFFGVGVFEPKTAHNIGTLWRSAYLMGAKFIFIVGGKYSEQSSDTQKTWSKIPFFKYKGLDHFYDSLPHSTQLVGIEMHKKSAAIATFEHPMRAAYLLGAEDNGLPEKVIEKCHHLVQLEEVGSLNVAVAGSIVIFDRLSKWKQ
jgi:tRNA G18 (ribose-2'-O)-methylase SpoU